MMIIMVSKRMCDDINLNIINKECFSILCRLYMRILYVHAVS